MMRSGRVSQPLIAGILAIYVALALWYSVTVPLGEAPDELPHFTYVRYLAQNGRLPTTTEEHEAFQPPLYYTAGAALTFWVKDEVQAPFAVRANANFDAVDPRAPKNLLLHTSKENWPYHGWSLAWHLVRLLSVFLGAITVWAVYRLGRVLFPAQPAITLTMAALTAFTPQFIFVSSVVNNDNAAIAFSALILWQVAATLHEQDGRRLWRGSVVLGVLLGLGLLSKANLVALVPIAGLAVVIRGYLCHLQGARLALRQTIVSLVMLGGIVLAVSGWYFARNLVLYGDPLGWSFLLEINALREGPLTMEILAWLGRGVFRSFWLGWIGIAFDEMVYTLISAACLVGAAGFVGWLFSGWGEMRKATRWTLVLLAIQAIVTIGVDSSVIIAGVHSNHPRHALAANWLVDNLSEHRLLVAHHSVLESYAVLTRLPGSLRVSPSEARDLLSATVKANMVVPKFDVESIWATLDTMVMASIVDGRSYDAFIFEILKSIGIDAFATFNPHHFHDLDKAIIILDPGKPKTFK